MAMASSAHYPSPEEFASSTLPPPTILLPRAKALRLLKLCESAEMTPSADFLDFVVGDNDESSSSSSGGGGGGNDPRSILVAQMALLVYLGEYGHARHLWRRHRRRVAPKGKEDGVVDDAAAAVVAANNSDYAQLERLWGAAKYIYLWDTGGIHSLAPSSSSAGGGGVPPSAAPSSTSAVADDDGMMMQVEEETAIEDAEAGSASASDPSEEEEDLPYSTLALRALRSCAESKIEPLATYARELEVVARSRFARRLRASFEKLDGREYCLRMNLDPSSFSGSGSGDDAEEVWGWKRSGGGYLMPDVDAISDDEDEDEGGAARGHVEEHRIGKLTDYVMFLEGRVNA